MALGNKYSDDSPTWRHRFYYGDDANFLEQEVAANVSDGYTPHSHAAFYDPDKKQRVVSILFRRSDPV
jgi:hypothetical protein